MKFAVIGCGSIGRRHAENLLSLEAGPVTICDPDPGALEPLRGRTGVKTTECLEEALQARPDAVLICTPTHLHLQAAMKALEAGAHLFIEKPISHSLAGTDQLLEKAEEKKRLVAVGCNMRFHPGVQILKAQLEALRPAPPLLFRAHFSHYLGNWRPGQDYRATYSAKASEGGGIILEGIHELDYLGWLSGERPAAGGRLRAFAKKHPGKPETDSEDYALLLADFPSGSTWEIQLNALRPEKSRGCEITKAGEWFLLWWSRGRNPESIFVAKAAPNAPPQVLLQEDRHDPNEMYLEEMAQFVRAVSMAGTASEMERAPHHLLTAEEACAVLTVALSVRQELLPPVKITSSSRAGLS